EPRLIDAHDCFRVSDVAGAAQGPAAEALNKLERENQALRSDAVQRLLDRGLESTGPANQPARHSDDYRSVHWFGTDHSFTPNQAAVVAMLWQAWENGTPDVGYEALLQAADSQGRLVDVFKIRVGKKTKKHPDWGTMVAPNVGGKGTCRLQP